MTFRKRDWKVMCVWLFFCESFSLFSVGIFSLPTVNKLRVFCHHIFWKCVWIFNREKRLYISIKIFAWFHNVKRYIIVKLWNCEIIIIKPHQFQNKMFWNRQYKYYLNRSEMKIILLNWIKVGLIGTIVHDASRGSAW